jgi:polyisoprenoid-binding protein YceI
VKKWVILLLLALSASLAWSQLSAVDQGSAVQFLIKNFGFSVTGTFSGLQGQIRFDPNNLSVDSFDVSVSASSINTDNSLRDNHLRESAYFDVKNYPRLHFVSTRVTNSTKSGTFFMFGKLSIKGTTKDISFPFTATPTAEGYVFQGGFKLNRRDFSIGSSSTISDILQVSLTVAARRTSP